MKKTLTIILPTLNEAGNISHLVEKITSIDQLYSGHTVKILVVDSGSTDSTVEEVHRLQDTFPNIQLSVAGAGLG